MKIVKIYGASDDLIYVIGGGFNEEFAGSKRQYVRFNDGTVLGVEYGPDDYGAKWRIKRVNDGTAEYAHEPAKNENDDYSDVVTLRGDLTSVQCGDSKAGPTEEEMVEFLVDFDWRRLSEDGMRKVYAIAKGQ